MHNLSVQSLPVTTREAFVTVAGIQQSISRKYNRQHKERSRGRRRGRRKKGNGRKKSMGYVNEDYGNDEKEEQEE